MSNLIRNGKMHLFGTVLKDEYIWPEDVGYFSSVMVMEALSQFQGDVDVLVNCDGGHPSEGEAIRAAFEAHPGKVNVMVTGNAHSAASLMIMSADRIEMSAGSLMLVHDPSTAIMGTPEALAAGAAELDIVADVYAGVYAARAGIPVETARTIMKADTMFSAQSAVDAGFADAVSPAPATMAAQDSAAARRAAIAQAGAAMALAHEAQMKFEAGRDPAPLENVEITPTETGVSNMPNTDPQNPVVATPAPAAPAPVMAAPAPSPVAEPVMQVDPVVAERARVKGLTDNAAPFMHHDGMADELARMVQDGTSVEAGNGVIMKIAAAAAPRTSRVEVTRDETQTRLDGMVGALMHRANPRMHALEGAAVDFRGLRLKSLAMHLGGTASGFNEVDVVRAGMRSTALMSGAMGVSDFAYITTEVMNRTLQAAYARRAATWARISRQRSASDFRELTSVLAGGDFALKPTAENGEYLQSTITDEAQGLKLAKYGRQINLTFEAVVNDDMGVFERLPGDFARAAGTLESKICWGAIRSNKAMKDGTAIFHADHKNVGASGAISVTTVGEARAAMYEQRAAGAKDVDDFIQVTPDLLFVPPKLETVAGQFVAATTPTKMSDANPFNTLTPVVEASLSAAAGGSDSQWYLFASDLPVLEHAYLDGYEAPTVVTKEGMNPDGVNMVARHIFAAAPVEYRGAYRRG